MDGNKRIRLKQIGYDKGKCCGVCAYSTFRDQSDWGICRMHTYQHQKHSQSARRLSINRYGVCRLFAANMRDDVEEFFEQLENESVV